MVVFAVLTALGVEQWRENRQLRRFADRARSAVDLEIGRNLDEFRRVFPGLTAKRDDPGQSLAALRDVQRGIPGDGVELTFEWDFPKASTAAWQVAQASPATPFFDYDWLLARAREYDELGRYQEVLDATVLELGALSGIAAGNDLDAIVESVEHVFGLLTVLAQLHEAIEQDLAADVDGRPPADPGDAASR